MNGKILLGAAAVLGLGILAMKARGGPGTPSGVQAAASHLAVYDEATKEALAARQLMSYKESGGLQAGMFVYTFTAPAGGEGSVNNPQAVICIAVQKDGTCTFECAKLAGVEPIGVFYDNVLECALTASSAIFRK